MKIVTMPTDNNNDKTGRAIINAVEQDAYACLSLEKGSSNSLLNPPHSPVVRLYKAAEAKKLEAQGYQRPPSTVLDEDTLSDSGHRYRHEKNTRELRQELARLRPHSH